MVINEEKEAQQITAAVNVANQPSKTGKSVPGFSRRGTMVQQKKDAGAILGAAMPQQLVFECFECGIPCQIDSKLGVNSLPKNMVLISASRSSVTTDKAASNDTAVTSAATTLKFKSNSQLSLENRQQASYDEDSSSLIQIPEDGTEVENSREEGVVSPMSESHAQCKLHPMKRIEAFCEKDFKLLCIDCILSERHKNHEIVSISKATEKHQAFLHAQQETSMQTSQKLISSKNEIQRHMQLMKVQAENNRRELSVLYNAIRDLLMQREQALKTFIAEVQEREEDQCQGKIAQIDDALSNIEDYEDNIAIALEETEIDLLRRFNERKLLVNTFNADTKIKDLQQLNVSAFGLAYGPPQTIQTTQTTGKNKKTTIDVLDDQPPFQSLLEINKASEQLQVSKMINPNFKGQISSCTGILPFTRGPEDKPSAQGNSLYQQHTAASQLKVNKRTNGSQFEKASGAVAMSQVGLPSDAMIQADTTTGALSTRPYQQYRRGNQSSTMQSGASPKPGDNKRRQTAVATTAYGAGTFSAKSRANPALAQQRTHSYGLSSFNHTANSSAATSNAHPTPALVKDAHTTSVSGKEINLFNHQQKAGGINQKRGAVQVSSRLNTQHTNKQIGVIPTLQHVTTQRISLQDEISLDLKQISAAHSNSDKQMTKLKTQKQKSDENSKVFPVKRTQRNNQEKLISDDLLHVQKQVNQVMSNLETFESKKRQLSAKKDQRIKMFNRSPIRTRQGNLVENTKTMVVGDNNNAAREMKTAQAQHRNSSSFCQGDQQQRMTSPPGKQQLLASQQPRKPAADNVIGDQSIGGTYSQEDDGQQQCLSPQQDPIGGDECGGLGDDGSSIEEGELLPVVHIKLEEQQATDSLQYQNIRSFNDRKLSNPNPQLQIPDGDSDYGLVVSTAQSATGNNLPRMSTASGVITGPTGIAPKHDSEESAQKTERERMKSPIVRIELNSPNSSSKQLHVQQRPSGSADSADEHIANMPELVNDSMVGDINQLISDLNKGHQPVRQMSANCQLEDVVENDSFEQKARALYFDLGTSGEFHNGEEGMAGQARTVDYIETQRKVSQKRPSGNASALIHNSAERAEGKRSTNKQKFIEQSVKAQQLQQNIQSAMGVVQQQQIAQQVLRQRDKSRDTSGMSRGPRVPELSLDKLTAASGSSNIIKDSNYNFLRTDRSNQEPTVPKDEPSKLIPNESGAGNPDQSLQAHNSLSTIPEDNEMQRMLMIAQGEPLNSQLTIQPLSATSSQHSMALASMSQASIDPFKALCQIRDEYIFVFSGFNERKLTHCEVFDTQRGLWKETAQIQNPRTKFAAVPISKTRILIFGGKQADGQRTADIEEYNLKSNSFKTLPFKMPKARSGFAACIKRDEARIYFCGGNSGSGSNGSVLRKFDCLDLKKGKWARLSDLLMKRDELSVAFGPDGNIYAIGGFGGGLIQPAVQPRSESVNEGPEAATATNTEQSVQQQQQQAADQYCQCLREAERYNFSTASWEMLPPMQEARRALAAVVLPDGIYAIGGYDGRQYLATVEKFDLIRQEWVYVKPMNTARCTLSAVSSSDCQYIYVLGGYNGKALNLVERYSVMNDTWELMPPMLVKRFMHQSVTLLRSEP